jgi:ATP-dependent DNA helicase RecG
VVAGSPNDPSPRRLTSPGGTVPADGGSTDRGLEQWCRLLQQASRLEAERGFGDLQGRHDTFSNFVCRSLTGADASLTGPERRRLADLAEAFAGYGSAPQPRRQQLVAQLRRSVHELLLHRRGTPAVAPPRLRLADRRATDSGADGGGGPLDPQTPLGEIAGVGARTATRLAGLGLFVVRDLLRHYPRDYLDYAHLVRIAALEPARTATIVATVRRSHAFTSPRNPNLSILELQLEDVTGRLRVTRFAAGRRFTSAAWLRSQQRQYPPGATVAVSGLVKDGPHGPCFADPLIEVLENPGAPVRSERIGRVVPVYGLTEGLTAEKLCRAIQAVLPRVGHWPDPLEGSLRRELALPSWHDALVEIHGPRDRSSLQGARRRLVFDEFLLLQLSLGQRRLRQRQRQAPELVPIPGQDLLQRFLALLSFPLTAAQRRVLEEIRADMARPQPMARLVQGDVGSGKTVVAIAAMLVAVEAGCQAVLMAPTEVLADQHFEKLAAWMPRLLVRCDRLTGSTPPRRRRELLQDLANGQLQLLVGTHALLEDPVRFARLGLVVVDEQHRFGVRQRDRLLAKGLQPHLLTMTATPIPRTLALSVHGDLDISLIDELPPGRTPVHTRLLRASERQEAHRLIRAEVDRGQRAYVVLPLVEDSETLDLRSAVEVHRQLQSEVFPDLEVGLLHGRLSADLKQSVIGAFARGDCRILVSTTVVEVGVDVPEASVMVVEHAERFGLAQLHQLRGRVGRGAAASHCLLIHEGRQAEARQRLEVLARSSDGFEIAEMDLRLRGPGQVLGTRQSGLPDFALASLSDDGEVLELSREVARRLLAADPDLEHHPGLRHALADQSRQQAARLN